MKLRHGLLVFSCIIALSLSSVHAQDYTNSSYTLDGAGNWSSGGTFSNISAIAQPSGIRVSQNGDMVNYAGFLNTFLLQPNLDTDSNGVPNELDPDNDGDGLKDLAEIEGTNFNPTTVTDVNIRDTDGDTFDDGAERIAGTDPTSSNSFLEIILIAEDGTDKEVKWIARSNKTYRVRRADNSFSLPTNVLATQTVDTPGTGVWDVAVGVYNDSTASNTRFYAIEVLP